MLKVWTWIRNAWVWFWTTIAKFVLHVLQTFKDNAGKTSWKRVSSAAALGVGIRQLIIGDHFGALVCIAYAAVMGLIAAITGS